MKKFLLSPLALLVSAASFAQVSIQTGVTITQDFNSIGSSATATLPTGWKADRNNNDVRAIGTYAAASNTTNLAGGANLVSNSPNGIYNFGSSSDGNDRAIGFLAVGVNVKSGNLYINLKNTNTSTISSLNINFNIEKYRNGTNDPGFYIELFYSTDGATWTSAGSTFKRSFGPDANSSGAATVPLNTNNASGTLSGLNLAQDDNLYLAWNYSVTSGTATGQSQVLAIDDISITAPQALPVTLISQTAKADRQQINLTWTTASELNNARFDILRANYTKSFIKIGEVKGAGTTQEIKDYTFVDKQPISGVNYYRLAQIDLDGKSTLSAIFSAKSNVASTEFNVSTGNDHTNILINTPNNGQASLNIYEVTGKKVLQKSFSLTKGYNNFPIPVQNPGIYVATLTVGNETISKKFTQ